MLKRVTEGEKDREEKGGDELVNVRKKKKMTDDDANDSDLKRK